MGTLGVLHVSRGGPMADGRYRRRRPAAASLVALAAIVCGVVLTAACGSATRSGRMPAPGVRAAASSSAAPASASATPSVTEPQATPDVTVAPAADDGAGCDYGLVGAALRPTVKVSGSTVTVSPGALQCPSGVVVFVADYLLSNDPADEAGPTSAGALLPGGSPVTLRFPASFAQCRASAVFFEQVGADSAAASLQVRQEVARWSASSRAYAPPATYVARYPKTRILLARNVSGLDACAGKSGQKVTTPHAAKGACWSDGPDSQPGHPQYEELPCTREHRYEVYYVEDLSRVEYLADLADHKAGSGGPDGWAERRSRTTCENKQSSIRFSGNYRISSLGTTYIWPTGLTAVGDGTVTGGSPWFEAQIICLVRRVDNQPVTKRILR